MTHCEKSNIHSDKISDAGKKVLENTQGTGKFALNSMVTQG